MTTTIDSPTVNQKPSLADDNNDIDNDNDDADDDDDFVFSDEFHAHEEFQNIVRLVNDAIGGSKRTKSNSKEILQKELQRRKKIITRRSIQKGQQEAISEILDEIDRIEVSYAAKGMREWNFTFGLYNVLLIFYIFGAHPGQFWIVYIIESIFWITLKFVGMWKAKPLCEVFYYLDFCWMMNFIGLLFFVGFFLCGNYLGHEIRRQMFLAAYGIAAGPVFGAAMVLPFVAFLFHDINTMANLVIHMLPSMLMFIMRWKTESMQDAYPNLFNLQYIEDTTQIPFDGYSFGNINDHGSVARNAIIVYLGWFIPYTLWMLLVGLKLPCKSDDPNNQPKYDTVFHSLWRGGPCEFFGEILWNRPKEISDKETEMNNFEIRDFMFYMIGHALTCTFLGIMVLARLCHYSQITHAICLGFAVLVCCRRGAQRYTYYTTAMYGNIIRKRFGIVTNTKDKTTTTTTKKQN